jgi:AcrR family transcriptional regulator
MRSRNDQEKAERRESLLDAAQQVFADKGFEKTSMDDIAEVAGFSRSLLYVYFKDKKDINRALRIRSAEILRDKIYDRVEENALGIDRVRQIGAAYYDFYLEDRDHFNCLSLDISLNNQGTAQLNCTEHNPEDMEVEREIMQFMVDVIEVGIEDKSIDPSKVSNLWQTAMFLRGCIHGVVLLQDKDGSPILQATNLSGSDLVNYTLDMVTTAIKAN